jgi:1-deoxy-D-xylulose-5-phosphate synthase
MVEAAEEASRVLEKQGVSASIWDVRVVKPLDPLMVADAATHPLVVTVEDGVREGGAGTAIADAVGATSEGRPSPAVVVLGVPDRYIAQSPPAAILTALGLDGPGIAASVIGALEAAEAVTEHN